MALAGSPASRICAIRRVLILRSALDDLTLSKRGSNSVRIRQGAKCPEKLHESSERHEDARLEM